MKRWPIKPLGELVDFVGGGTPRRDRPDYWGGEVPWASVKDLQSQSLETTLETITAKGLANSASNLIPKGTVIIASRVGLGKVAINLKPVAINQDLKALTPRHSDLSPRYLLLFLLSKAEYFERTGVGATVKGLTLVDYQKLDIVLPPLTQQERIVRLLDEADELRKLRAQADQRTAALIPSLFHEMFGDPALNAKNFPVKLLAEVAFFQEGPGVRKWQFRSSGIKLINVGNIVEGQIDLSRTERHLDKKEAETTYKHFLLSAGDLVMATSGATWGKVAVVEAHHLPLCMNTSVVRFRPLTPEICHSMFLRGFFESKTFRRQIEKLITGSAQPNFGPSHLRQIRLPIPPLPLQKEFAARVTEIRVLQAEQAASRRHLDDLFQSMLHRAFRGEL